MMKKGMERSNENQSLRVDYLTTAGSKVNNALSVNSIFNVPAGLSTIATRMVSEPVLGQDEVKGKDLMNSISRYYMVTNNRLVTPADVKIFCYNEMLRRYNIDSSMINRIVVKNQILSERGHSGFETIVEIVVANNAYIKRSFESQTIQAEWVLQKMIEVRSATPYPVQVSIRIV